MFTYEHISYHLEAYCTHSMCRKPENSWKMIFLFDIKNYSHPSGLNFNFKREEPKDKEVIASGHCWIVIQPDWNHQKTPTIASSREGMLVDGCFSCISFLIQGVMSNSTVSSPKAFYHHSLPASVCSIKVEMSMSVRNTGSFSNGKIQLEHLSQLAV